MLGPSGNGSGRAKRAKKRAVSHKGCNHRSVTGTRNWRMTIVETNGQRAARRDEG